jgi:hypothetical protein
MGYVYFKRRHKGCIHRQRFLKRWPLSPVRGVHRAASVLSAALLTSLVGIGPTPAATCASLAGLALPDTAITAAQSVAAGTYVLVPDSPISLFRTEYEEV